MAAVFLLLLVVAHRSSSAEAPTKSRVVCLEGMKSFAADSSQGDNKYWECNDGVSATLRTCPGGKVYHRRSGRCRTAVSRSPDTLRKRSSGGGNEELEVLQLENLNSNSEQLGAIYNARTGQFVTGRNLWGSAVTAANMVSQPLVYSNLETYQEQDIDDRVYHLGVKAGLSLSLLSGAISVSGTAEYLRNEQVKSETAVVVMKYTSTRVSETMPLTTEITNKRICDMAAMEGGPTHVVSSLTRGLRAFLKFQKSVSLTDTKEDIGGRLSVAINTIPSFKFEGSAWININGSEVKNIEGVSVTYYGDATIKNPTSYLAAIEAFENIQAKAPTSSKIVRYQLVPLSFLCTADVKQLQDIQDNLVQAAAKTLTELEKIKEKTDILRYSYVARTVSTIANVLNTFANKLQIYTDDYKASIREQLLTLKNGGSEAELITLIHEYQQSAFSFNKARLFLEIRAREISTIGLILDAVQDRKIFAITSKNDDIEFFHKYKYAVFFVMNVLPEANVADDFIETKQIPDESGAWYNSLETVGRVGKELRNFITFARANKAGEKHGFIITIKKIKQNSHPVYCKFYRPKTDVEVMELPFPPPSAPPTPVCLPRYRGFDLRTAPTTNPNVTLHYVKAERYEDDKPSIDTSNPKTAETVSIGGLIPATQYNVSTAYKVFDKEKFPDAGYSPWTPLISCWTAPSTPVPLEILNPTKSSLTLSLGAPTEAVTGALVYRVVVEKEGSADTLHFTRSTPGQVDVEDLAPASLYKFSVWTELGESKSAVSRVDFVTSPSIIPFPEVLRVDQTKIELVVRLSQLYLAPGLVPTLVTAFVHRVDSRGDPIPRTDSVISTPIEENDEQDFVIVISDCEYGVSYGIALQLTTVFDGVTMLSDRTDSVQVTTPMEGDEADKVMKEIEQVKRNVTDMIEDVSSDVEKEAALVDAIDTSEVVENIDGQLRAFEGELSHNLTIQSEILRGVLKRSCIHEGQNYYEKYSYKTPGSSVFECSSKCSARSNCESTAWDSKTKTCYFNTNRVGDIISAKKFMISMNNLCKEVLGGITKNWKNCKMTDRHFTGSHTDTLTRLSTPYDCVMSCVKSSQKCMGVTWYPSNKNCVHAFDDSTLAKSSSQVVTVSLACLAS